MEWAQAATIVSALVAVRGVQALWVSRALDRLYAALARLDSRIDRLDSKIDRLGDRIARLEPAHAD